MYLWKHLDLDFDREVLMSEGITQKTVAIMGGGDWYDASVDLLDLPYDLDLEDENKNHRHWYDNEYCPALRSGNKPRYLSFPEWLIERCGAKKNESIEEYWDY
jgi:hypothetical protein